MKKKFLATICAAALLMVGCGGEKSPEPAQDSGKTTIGIITRLNVSETEYNEYMKKLEKSYLPLKAHLSANYKYFDKMNDMQLALESNQIDILSTYRSVANYMLQRSDNKEILPTEKILSDTFCFAVRESDTKLKNTLNRAIKSMLDDGKLASLSKTYIVDIKNGAEPPAVPITKIEGADTIKVAVTGDLPPFDMVLADGTPAGFSTAVLAEISRRINKNIELVSVDSVARASILASKGADVVFWVAVPNESILIPANIDQPTGIGQSLRRERPAVCGRTCR